ncbi:SurA N-terminal domain-containing protein [Pasteurellaceae bacterium 20609_3]|uniref:SurA N-terminal domain-containing protein n=1 Tax=Spirabiliibacterium mucosae TaxID=28156 RepID=UPI001AAD5D5E|nr:SurA N-terminal domain-containing protein [Spirabiliibacterium mucosae]MBE2898051.1 SurA N-terminal domain-containing protein [Spirabiliibacterium mucosae]
MMEKLSNGVGGWVWKVIFALVSVSFVLGGVGTYLVGRVDTSAAKVNGEEISQRAFQNALQQQTRSMGEQMGPQFAQLMDSPEFVASLRQDVINNLVDDTLLAQYVNELGLAVSDEQIKRYIVSQPAFQKDGKFDNERYQQFLRVNGLNADYYAQSLRGGIVMSQLQQGLLGSQTVSEAQLAALNEQLYQTREVNLTALPIAKIQAAQSVSDEEVSEYYKAHQSAFAVPEQVKVEFIDIAKPDIEKNINVTDVEIAQYYQDHKSDFAQNRQHLAHIQVGSEEQANALYQQLQQGADFAELAKANSTDKLSAVNGGDLSWSKAGAFPEKFEQVANTTAVGEVSKPVDVDGAYHIIKVIAREDNAPSLEQVKGQVEQAIRNELAATDFYRVEKEAAEKAFENQASLDDVEKAVGKKVQTTGFFTRQDVPAELNFSNVVYNIFDTDLLQGGMNSEAINVGDQHSIILRVVDHKPAGTRSLEEAKADIVAYLKQEKAQAELMSQAKSAVDALNQGQKATLPEGVSLNDKVEKFVYLNTQDAQLRDGIFSIQPKAQGDYAVVRNGQGEVFIAKLLEVSQGKADEKQAQAIREGYLQNEQRQAYRRLIQALRDKAKIEINNEFISQRDN